MRKIMSFMERAEAVFERLFILVVACALLAVLLSGCDCDCYQGGTLMLRDGSGNYNPVCHGKYIYHSKYSSSFRCDDGREIMQPTNFIIQK